MTNINLRDNIEIQRAWVEATFYRLGWHPTQRKSEAGVTSTELAIIIAGIVAIATGAVVFFTSVFDKAKAKVSI